MNCVLLFVACGDGHDDAAKSSCSGVTCPSGGSAGAGGSGGASGRGGSAGGGGASGSSGRGGAGGTATPDAGGRGGSAAGGSGGTTAGSGGGSVLDGGPAVDASRDAADAGSEDGGRQCIELSRVQDSGTCTLSACRRGATVEISATHTTGWYVGALFWVLTVCDTSFTLSRSPGGSLRTLIYDVPETDWAKLREGDPVFMQYGTPASSAPGLSCGPLTRNIQSCPP